MKKGDELFNKTENLLYEYRDIDVIIKNIEYDLEIYNFDENYDGCGAIDYSNERTSRTFKISKPTEMEVINKNGNIISLKLKLNRKKILKRKIENALTILNEDEKKIIEMRYLSRPGKNWGEVSEIINLDRSTCAEINNKKIIPKLASILFA